MLDPLLPIWDEDENLALLNSSKEGTGCRNILVKIEIKESILNHANIPFHQCKNTKQKLKNSI